MKKINLELERRMYFFVPYNLSPIQQAIQAGHAALEYAIKYHDPECLDENSEVFYDFAYNWKTWVILNGGTTNSKRGLDTVVLGSLDQIGDDLLLNEIPFAYFHEPDLNDALTAVCFVCDERVFNRKDYPDLPDYLYGLNISTETDMGKSMHMIASIPLIAYKIKADEKLQEEYPKQYKAWVKSLGGKKNVFLRELIKDKRLA